jgi:hypothetical protein
MKNAPGTRAEDGEARCADAGKAQAAQGARCGCGVTSGVLIDRPCPRGSCTFLQTRNTLQVLICGLSQNQCWEACILTVLDNLVRHDGARNFRHMFAYMGCISTLALIHAACRLLWTPAAHPHPWLGPRGPAHGCSHQRAGENNFMPACMHANCWPSGRAFFKPACYIQWELFGQP